MYICPVCGKRSKTENGICTSCRFDRSRNYEAYATISPLKGKNSHAISKKSRIMKVNSAPELSPAANAKVFAFISSRKRIRFCALTAVRK